jgi:hypothetical protein
VQVVWLVDYENSQGPVPLVRGSAMSDRLSEQERLYICPACKQEYCTCDDEDEDTDPSDGDLLKGGQP